MYIVQAESFYTTLFFFFFFHSLSAALLPFVFSSFFSIRVWRCVCSLYCSVPPHIHMRKIEQNVCRERLVRVHDCDMTSNWKRSDKAHYIPHMPACSVRAIKHAHKYYTFNYCNELKFQWSHFPSWKGSMQHSQAQWMLSKQFSFGAYFSCLSLRRSVQILYPS